jgi:peptidoglycan/xylan/chitin deacetylase (PgdA/CDA1 family)
MAASKIMRTADLLEQYGFDDVIFYIPSDWHFVNRLHGDVPLTEHEVVDLNNRFKVGSHTISHQMLTRIPYEEMVEQVVQSKAQLERLLGGEVEDFCYPRGYANDGIRDVVRQHYKTARNTLVGSLTASEDPVWEYTTVHIAGKRRTDYEDTTWLAEGRRLLAEAVKLDKAGEDVIFHFWGHSWEIDKYFEWGNFEIFLQEMKAAA